jgi:ubiquinone biosynthesis protein UbiJ
MATINKFLRVNPERNLFNQIAAFSVAGLAMSLALAFTCDLQIAAQWI